MPPGRHRQMLSFQRLGNSFKGQWQDLKILGMVIMVKPMCGFPLNLAEIHLLIMEMVAARRLTVRKSHLRKLQAVRGPVADVCGEA